MQAIERCFRDHVTAQARFVLELLVSRALLAEHGHPEAVKVASRGGKIVGHVRDAHFQLARQGRVGGPHRFLVCKIVAVEDGEPHRASARRALDAEAVDGEREEASKPLAMEERVELLNSAGVLALKLALRGSEIERHELDAAASFQPAALLPDVGDEPVEARPEVRAEPRPRGIEARK